MSSPEKPTEPPLDLPQAPPRPHAALSNHGNASMHETREAADAAQAAQHRAANARHYQSVSRTLAGRKK